MHTESPLPERRAACLPVAIECIGRFGQMASGVKRLATDLSYDVMSIGYPCSVLPSGPVAEPHNVSKLATLPRHTRAGRQQQRVPRRVSVVAKRETTQCERLLDR